MIKPNWDIFKAKFSNPQNAFEWFCYLLFSREFDRPLGIARYKNQVAIETEIIQNGSDVVGWQAKFYDTPLSKHKEDIIDTVKAAKKHYPKITKILFYTNQEWSQAKGKEPKGKIAVEAEAKKLGVSFEWRTASFFESTFVSVDNSIIAQNFFVYGKSIFDFLKELQTHTENILNEISTHVQYEKAVIEIDRTEQLEKLKNATEQVIILSGAGGVGKTALIKKFYESVKDSIPFYIFKSTEFELARINDLFHLYSLQDFLDAHKEEPQKIIVIDSAEKLLDLKNSDPFKELFSSLLSNGWKLIFTTRDNYLEDLNYNFFEIYKVTPSNIGLQNLGADDLTDLSTQYGFLLPEDAKLLDLIRNPFYLREYLRIHKEDEDLNYRDFKDRLWNKNIRKGKPARELCFMQVASERVTAGQFFVKPDCESAVLDELTHDGILGYESPHGYFITHDVYEEWALEKHIEAEFHKKTNIIDFFKNIGSALPIEGPLGNGRLKSFF